MINYFLIKYMIAKVLLEEMNCYGYRKGNWQFTKIIKVRTFK